MTKLRADSIHNKTTKEVKIGLKTVEIPIDWQIKELGEFVRNEGQPGIHKAAEDFNEGLYRYVRMADITEEGNLKDGEKKSIPKEGNEKYELKENDFLFVSSGKVGLSYLHKSESSDIPCVYANFLIRFELNTDKILPEYLLYFTQSYYYRNWVNSVTTGGAIKRISTAEYQELPVILPPLSEQAKIVEILSTVDEVVQKYREITETTKKLKKGLIQDLFSGESQHKEGEYT